MTRQLKALVDIAYGNGLYPAITNRISEYRPPETYYRFGAVPGLPEGFHTFVDDWRLESIWRNNDKLLDRIITHRSAILPDYTVETNYPLALQTYQIWRSRVIGRWWQDHGVMPIPVLQWGAKMHWSQAFTGLQDCEILAVRGPARGKEHAWEKAVTYFLHRHTPKLILHFGRRAGFDRWPHAVHYPLKTDYFKKQNKQSDKF
ncbi:MAG: DUF4417 domain-containing protein [Gammaproteobacteria bacterium]